MKDTQPSSKLPKKPNFLIILVDEERYPPIYENNEIQDWRKQNLTTQQLLRAHGLEFHRHYIGSSACCPSRATILTGQYPSLHGVSQTTGMAKEPFDSDMFWLNRNTVPTMGNYFREAGYQTYYKGKWHITFEDIIIPGTHKSLSSYDPLMGVPNAQEEALYKQSNRLDDFGFSGWIGPEPHGKNPRNSGSSAAIGLSGRDEIYANEVVELLEDLQYQKKLNENAKPWLVVASFVNPHDIVLYGALSTASPFFKFDVDSTIPDVAPPPTINELLYTKPRCQANYRDIYPKALQPILNQPFYRKLYYQLQKNVDHQMMKVFKALTNSPFYDDTIVIFTSDHGDLLGAHGNMHQKWYSAYEEFLHVPFIIHNRHLFTHYKSNHSLTSHVDLLPTLLGLANANISSINTHLKKTFSEVHSFVGKDLSSIILEKNQNTFVEEPIYFMTDDDVTRGQHQINPLGEPYPSVIQPNHVETIITTLQQNGKQELWKLSRYFDNIQFWSQPGTGDITFHPALNATAYSHQTFWISQTKKEPVPDEYELYNLTDDPLETCNLANPLLMTAYTQPIQAYLTDLLNEQRNQKRLYPSNQLFNET